MVNINELILDPIPYEWGYISEDNNWMAVPFADNYMVIKNDQQIKSFKKLNAAKKYIQNKIQDQEQTPSTKNTKTKKVKTQKSKKASSLEDFM